MPEIVDIEIQSVDQREFSNGKESKVRFVLRFEDGSSSQLRGHGVSHRNGHGGFRVTHVLIAEEGPEFSYWSYEAEPIHSETRDYHIRGVRFSNREAWTEFQGTLRNVQQREESLEEFLEREFRRRSDDVQPSFA